MKRVWITRRRGLALAAATAAAVIATAAVVALRSGSGEPNIAAKKHSETHVFVHQSLRERFALLSDRDTNKCGLGPESLESIAVGGRLQGSCCQSMDFGSYVRQVEGLKRYAAAPEVPADPYDIPVSLATRLVAYDKQITLSAVEQEVYQQAVRLSDEHGPCCCRCWRWTAFEGQAKKLIVERRLSARQISAIWSLENGCGGTT